MTVMFRLAHRHPRSRAAHLERRGSRVTCLGSSSESRNVSDRPAFICDFDPCEVRRSPDPPPPPPRPRESGGRVARDISLPILPRPASRQAPRRDRAKLADTVDGERETTSVTVGLPARDLNAARAWYERVLGKVADIEPVPGILEFEVHPGSWLQLHDGDRTVFRIGVKDVEAARGRLATMGIDVGPIERIEAVIAFFEFADPDGNLLSLYQVLE